MKVYVVLSSDEDGNRFYVRVLKSKREADDMVSTLERLYNNLFIIEEEI